MNINRSLFEFDSSYPRNLTPMGGDNAFKNPNFAQNKSLPIHRWVPWVAGFSNEFVHSSIQRHLQRKEQTVLDPFCGVGTTLLCAINQGHNAIGFEINPYAAFASKVKANAHEIDAIELNRALNRFRQFYITRLGGGEVRSNAPKGFKTKNTFYSPMVLKKVLIVQDFIHILENPEIRDLFRLAVGSTLVDYSNYSYEPSLSSRKSAGKKEIDDYDVGGMIAKKVGDMSKDITYTRKMAATKLFGKARVISDSFFNYRSYLEKESVDLLITSPPYLNNYHYVRNTRPQLYWLGFGENPQDFIYLNEDNFGKYWQTVRQRNDLPLIFKSPDGSIEQCIEKIRAANNHRGVYGGRGWANYVTAYLNDCYRFAEGMNYCLKPSGIANIVIGNNVIQGVSVPTDRFLGMIAELVGLRLVGIHIPRTERVGNSIIRSSVRVGAAKKDVKLYEAVVELAAN